MDEISKGCAEIQKGEEVTDDLWGLDGAGDHDEDYEIQENISSDEEGNDLGKITSDSVAPTGLFTNTSVINTDTRISATNELFNNQNVNKQQILTEKSITKPTEPSNAQPKQMQVLLKMEQQPTKSTLNTVHLKSMITPSLPTSPQVFIKPVGSKEPGQLFLHSSNSSVIGSRMLNQPDTKQIMALGPVVPSGAVGGSQVIKITPNSIKPGQLVYVNPHNTGNIVLQSTPTIQGPVVFNQTAKSGHVNPAPIFIPSTLLSKNMTGNVSQMPSPASAVPIKIPIPQTQNISQPKPGQLVLQTVDGQKLLLQPINNKSDASSSAKTSSTSKIIIQQGQNNFVTHGGKQFVPLQSLNKQAPQTALKSAVASTKQPIFIPFNASANNQQTNSSATKLQKQVDVDTSSFLEKKSVLLNILTNPATEKPRKNINENIEVFELRPGSTRPTKGTFDLLGKSSNTVHISNKDSQREIPFFSKSGNKKEDTFCSVPLKACGSETLEHLISLTEKKNEVPSFSFTDVSDERSQSPVTVVQDMPKQPCASSLLKDALKEFPVRSVLGGNRRKQILTNRTAEAEPSFIKTPAVIPSKPKKKKKTTPKPKVVVETSSGETESDEIISSINDFDLESEYFSSNSANNSSFDVNDGYKVDISIKTEPRSPTSEEDATFPLKISDICSLNIDANLQGNSDIFGVKRERVEVEDTKLTIQKKIKPDPDAGDCAELVSAQSGQTLTSEDLVRRSYRIFSKPTNNFQSGNIHTNSYNSSQKEFIPISNVMTCVKTEKLETSEGNTTMENSDPLAPFDYARLVGPVSVKVCDKIDETLAAMAMKECYVNIFSDFHIIESRYAINGLRNVYTCNHCKGEYATVNLKSLLEHIEMHRKFPKIHQLVQERPYEVTALSGSEISEMFAGAAAVMDHNIVGGIQPTTGSSKDGVGTKKCVCKLCPYEAKSTRSLESHMNVHGMAERKACDICHVVYRNEKVLGIHKMNEHKMDARKLPVVYISTRPL